MSMANITLLIRYQCYLESTLLRLSLSYRSPSLEVLRFLRYLSSLSRLGDLDLDLDLSLPGRYVSTSLGRSRSRSPPSRIALGPSGAPVTFFRSATGMLFAPLAPGPARSRSRSGMNRSSPLKSMPPFRGLSSNCPHRPVSSLLRSLYFVAPFFPNLVISRICNA